MRGIHIITLVLFMGSSILVAQVPQKINYQAVARNSSGVVLANQNIAARFTIHDGTSNGTVVYQETKNTSTNQFGLFTHAIGSGSVTQGSMLGINWANASKYLQVEIDVMGGTNYTDLGATELVSVPYALYAGNSATDSVYANGTINHIAKFSSTNTLSNSQLYDNGLRVGIGTVLPLARLHVADSSVVFTGPTTLPTATNVAPPISGAGVRMMWYPQKAAIRAGGTDGKEWDKDSIGNYSVAFGNNSVAKGAYAFATSMAVARGDYAIALGPGSSADKTNSVAIGPESWASGESSTAIGGGIALGYYSVSIGGSSTIGNNSIAMGNNIYAKSFRETVLGSYNEDYIPSSTTSWIASDRLLVVGNGLASNSTSNALTILKSGNTGIATSSPNSTLQVNGTFASKSGSTASNQTIAGSGVNIDNAYFIELNATTANARFKIPAANSCPGRMYVLFNASGNSAIIESAGGTFFGADGSSGASTFNMPSVAFGRMVHVMSDGNNWLWGRYQ